MSGIIVANEKALPRSIDVTVNVSKSQTESTTDLSVPVFCTPNADFDQSANRLRVYSSLSAVADDFSTSSEPYRAATDFFKQSPRAKRMAIARIFTAACSGFLQCGESGQTLATWKAVTAGSFVISIDGVSATVSSLDFSAITAISQVAEIIQTGIRAASAGVGFTAATVTYDTSTLSLRITSGSTGNSSTVSGLTAPVSGTDIKGASYINGYIDESASVKAAYAVPGYVPSTVATAGYLTTGVVQQTIGTWTAVTTGSFKITIDGVAKDVTGLNFSGASTLPNVATIIQTGIRAAWTTAGFTAATVTYDSTSEKFVITSGTTGITSTVGLLAAAASGSDISGSGFMAGTTGTPTAGIDSTITGELSYIAEAASAQNMFLYGWTLDKIYRDTDDAVNFMEWIEAQDLAIGGVVSNSPLATDASSTTDVCAVAKTNGYKRSYTVYHNNAYYYPELAIMAIMLSVNYEGISTTMTAKFKDLTGIPTVPLTETEYNVLLGKRANTFTLTGNDARTFREGIESNSAWYIDDLINLDNFKEELQVNVFNVFLLNKKVPYTAEGVGLLYNAIDQICQRFVTNGTFAPRPLTSSEAGNDVAVSPAYDIQFAALSSMTASDRGSRIGPPCTLTVNLAGAIHSLTIDVTAVA